MKSKMTTIESKFEPVSSKKSKRIMGFKEWCEAVWKPREHSMTQTFLSTPQGTVHGRR